MLTENRDNLQNEAFEFERAFLDAVLELAARGGEENFSAIARVAFPHKAPKAAARAFRRIRNEREEGKVQSIKLRDAYNFAKAVGRDVNDLAYDARRRVIDERNLERLKTKSST